MNAERSTCPMGWWAEKTNKRTIKCCSISFSCETPEGTIHLYYSRYSISFSKMTCFCCGYLLCLLFVFVCIDFWRWRRNMKRERVRTTVLCDERPKEMNIIMEDAWPKSIDIGRSSVSFKKTGIESTTDHFVIGKRPDRTCNSFALQPTLQQNWRKNFSNF